MPEAFRLDDIARECRLSRSTVSRALRNHPRISEETKRRVNEAARKLGYKPNPLISAYTSYVRTRRPATVANVLGFITGYDRDPEAWRSVPSNVELFESASERASSLGYRLDVFWTGSRGGLTPAQFNKMLITRNIRGLLLCPTDYPYAFFDLEWQEFATISIGYSVKIPSLAHRVAPNHHSDMMLAIRELRRRGFRRIGFATSRHMNYGSDHQWISAYLHYSSTLPEEELVPIYLPEWVLDRDRFLRWFSSAAPDAILTGEPQVAEWLSSAGVQIPGDVALAQLNIAAGDKHFSGIREDYPFLGRRAMELLIGLVQRNELGSPDHGSVVMVEGKWKDGETVPLHAPERKLVSIPKTPSRKEDYLKHAVRARRETAKLNASSFSGQPAKTKFTPVDLTSYFNRSRRRWFGALPLENMPLGDVTFHGVPFSLSNGPDLGSPTVLMFASRRCVSTEDGSPLPNRVSIPVGGKTISEIFFLHSCGWAHEEVFATYRVEFADGGYAEQPVCPAPFQTAPSKAPGLIPPSIQDWWPAPHPLETEDVLPVCIADPSDAMRSSAHLYVFRWKLPFGQKGKSARASAVERIVIEADPGKETTLAILGITLAGK